MRETEIQPKVREEIAIRGTSAQPMLIVDGRWESTRTAAENLERQTKQFEKLKRDDITPKNLRFLLNLSRNTDCWAGSIAEVCAEKSGSVDEDNSLSLLWQATRALSHEIWRLIDLYMEKAWKEASKGNSRLSLDFNAVFANYTRELHDSLF